MLFLRENESNTFYWSLSFERSISVLRIRNCGFCLQEIHKRVNCCAYDEEPEDRVEVVSTIWRINHWIRCVGIDLLADSSGKGHLNLNDS